MTKISYNEQQKCRSLDDFYVSGELMSPEELEAKPDEREIVLLDDVVTSSDE